MSSHRLLVIASLVSLAAFALLAAGCGGGGHAPGVASLGATGTTTTASTPAGGSESSGAPSAGPAGGQAHFSIGMNVGTTDGPKFSACMRRHGVPSFPDPNGQGVIQIHSGMGIDPQSPTFQSARKTCQKLLPNGGQPTPAQLAQRQQEMLAFSACMRAHGLKDFPDPSNGGLQIRIQPGSDLDPSKPTFQRAQQACRKYMPFKASKSVGG